VEQGQIVQVVEFGGRRLVRRVVLDRGNSVVVCSEREYAAAVASKRRPEGIGFPRKDVKALPPSGAMDAE